MSLALFFRLSGVHAASSFPPSFLFCMPYYNRFRDREQRFCIRTDSDKNASFAAKFLFPFFLHCRGIHKP